MKKKVIIIVICVILVLILLGATLFSISKFNVINPFSSFTGMMKILVGFDEYVVVQEWPKKIVFSKSNETGGRSGKDYLDEYMESLGYEELKNEQTGGTLCYTNGVIKQYIGYSTNSYYSKWTWEGQAYLGQEEENTIVSKVNNINLTDIPEELSVDKAVTDRYFIITPDGVYNREVLDEFVRNTKHNNINKEDNQIRIVAYNENGEPTIFDIQYKVLDEKYIDENGQEVNKTNFTLIYDQSRVKSWEATTDYQEQIERQAIKVNTNLPGEYYELDVTEDEEFQVGIITLKTYKESEQYKDIEITRFPLNVPNSLIHIIGE